MKKITKKESKEIQRQAITLLNLLRNLSEKYIDEEEGTPIVDLYAKEYNTLTELREYVLWWLDYA